MQDGAEDREQDDQARGHIYRRAEDALERHVEMPNEAVGRIAAMGPGFAQMISEERVQDEDDRHEGHDDAGRPPRTFQQEHDENDTDEDVHRLRHDRAVAELLALHEDVDDHAQACESEHPIPPADAIAHAPRHREEQKDKKQDARDVDGPQDVRRNDVEGRINVEQRDADGDCGDRRSDDPADPIECAFLFLDVLLDDFAIRLGGCISYSWSVLGHSGSGCAIPGARQCSLPQEFVMSLVVTGNKSPGFRAR